MILKKHIINIILVIRDFDFKRWAMISECKTNSLDFFVPISRLTIRRSNIQRITHMSQGHNNDTIADITFKTFKASI